MYLERVGTYVIFVHFALCFPLDMLISQNTKADNKKQNMGQRIHPLNLQK